MAVSEQVVEPPELGNVSQSEYGKNTNFSFASGAFANNLKNRVRSIKDKQNEYVMTSVPVPKQRKKWKQDLSQM